jgi:sugar phosphate isomerase/epimerase
LTSTVRSRISVSAISSFRNSLAEDLALWKRLEIDNVGVSVAKLDAHGWDDGVARVQGAVADGLRVGNLIGVGAFELARPAQWDQQRARLLRVIDTAATLDTRTLVFTTGPSIPLPWEEAADALEAALAPVLPHARANGVDFAIEHTNSLRVDVGFVHSLHDVIDLARRLDTGVCMEINACWAERDLTTTIAGGVDRIRLVQVSDYRVGTRSTPDRLVPGDGDIPIARILAMALGAGYGGDFDLELIGPEIDAEGYDAAIVRSVDALSQMLDDLGS